MAQSYFQQRLLARSVTLDAQEEVSLGLIAEIEENTPVDSLDVPNLTPRKTPRTVYSSKSSSNLVLIEPTSFSKQLLQREQLEISSRKMEAAKLEADSMKKGTPQSISTASMSVKQNPFFYARSASAPNIVGTNALDVRKELYAAKLKNYPNSFHGIPSSQMLDNSFEKVLGFEDKIALLSFCEGLISHLKDMIIAEAKKATPEFPLNNNTFLGDAQLYSRVFENKMSDFLLETCKKFPAESKYQMSYVKDMLQFSQKHSETPYEKMLLLCAMSYYLERNSKNIKDRELFTVRKQNSSVDGGA